MHHSDTAPLDEDIYEARRGGTTLVIQLTCQAGLFLQADPGRVLRGY